MVVLKTVVSTTTETSEGLSSRIRLNAGGDHGRSETTRTFFSRNNNSGFFSEEEQAADGRDNGRVRANSFLNIQHHNMQHPNSIMDTNVGSILTSNAGNDFFRGSHNNNVDFHYKRLLKQFVAGLIKKCFASQPASR
jgi:hypothetical protein